VAPTPHGADPYADHEPAASGSPERLRAKKRLWGEAGREQLAAIRLAPWASRRRHDLLELLDRLNPTIAKLTEAVEQEAEKCPAAQLAMRRGRKIAKLAMARRLAIRLYWMWRQGWSYEQLTQFGSHAGQPGNPHGVE
jgi:hypothetical protein